MHIPRLLFGLLILMAIAVMALFFVEEVPGSHGFDHPGYQAQTIQQAPAGIVRHRDVIWIAGCFGALVSLFTVGSMTLGLSKPHREGSGATVVLAVGVVYTILLVATVLLYWKFIEVLDFNLFGFPVSTAWMLFLLGTSPLGLIVVYMIFFSRWILRPEDLEQFHNLVASRNQQQTD